MSYKLESLTLDDQLMARQFAAARTKSTSEHKVLERPKTPIGSSNGTSTFTPQTPTNRLNSFSVAQLFTPTQKPKSEKELYANFFSRLESHQVQLLRDRSRWSILTPQSRGQ